MSKQIKNLLFDLGGVIMDIERERCVEALTALGMEGANEMLGLYVQSGPFLKLEEGEMSPHEFCDEVRRRIPGGGGDVTDEQVHEALNAFLIGIPAHRLVELRMLRNDFGIYLLSNTNPIMYQNRRVFPRRGTRDERLLRRACHFLRVAPRQAKQGNL